MRWATFMVSAAITAGLAAPAAPACRCAHDGEMEGSPVQGCCDSGPAQPPLRPDPTDPPHSGPCCCLDAPEADLPKALPAVAAPGSRFAAGIAGHAAWAAPADRAAAAPTIRPRIPAPPPRGAPLFLLQCAFLL